MRARSLRAGSSVEKQYGLPPSHVLTNDSSSGMEDSCSKLRESPNARFPVILPIHSLAPQQAGRNALAGRLQDPVLLSLRQLGV